MKVGERKQHVPIFVGSTFEDLKDYRRAVRDALIQLETIVRGMEYFGSKPGSPIDECLVVVKSCKVYIGIFGMRYGSVPDGYDKSMTHLEYDEAQNRELPSLIYIIDEETQPILPIYVETGSGAESLHQLKDSLRRNHVISSFTTTEDLASKVLHDVPEVLRTIGTTVEDELSDKNITSSEEMLSKFKLLPNMLKGRDVVIGFVMNSFRSVSADECHALRFESGATICNYTQMPNGDWLNIYASNEVAEKILDIPQGELVRAEAVTAYGMTNHVDYGEDGPLTRTHEHIGVYIKRILEVTPPETNESS